MVDVDTGGLIYGLEFQCRALCAVEAEEDNINFLIGTQGIKARNQVHFLEMDEETRSLSKVIFSHPIGEVWGLTSSPKDANLFISRHSSIVSDGSKCVMGATLWSCQQDGDFLGSGEGSVTRDLTEVCRLHPHEEDYINFTAFMPECGDKVMILSGSSLILQDVSQVTEHYSKEISHGKLEGKGQTTLSSGAWNPHQNSQTFAAVNEHVVRAWDIRSMNQVWSIENPGQQSIRSIDFNPNKQYHMVSAGDDGCLRFWDIRQPKKALITRMDHSHWVWCVRFNQFHDQLVLSSSSDYHVVLSCISSISSEPLDHFKDDEVEGVDLDTEEDDKAVKGQKKRADATDQNSKACLEDGVLRTYEDHEESVYVTAWSSSDPWTFASLSFDGRLVINQVPRDVKFKILNLV